MFLQRKRETIEKELISLYYSIWGNFVHGTETVIQRYSESGMNAKKNQLLENLFVMVRECKKRKKKRKI